MRSSLTVHTLIKNEENWVWYAINSVIEYVDKILVYDTGSTDKTVEIINSINSPKIVLTEKGNTDSKGITNLRQEMLDRTKTDWFMILDGDEIWTDLSINELITSIKLADRNKKGIVVSPWICQGDIFHYSINSENIRSPYGKKGYWHVRVFNRNIIGLKAVGIYPNEGFSGSDERAFSEYEKNELVFLQGRYLHMTSLPRSSSRLKDRQALNRFSKANFGLGTPFPRNFQFPEVLYKSHSILIPSPWRKYSVKDKIYRYGSSLFKLVNS